MNYSINCYVKQHPFLFTTIGRMFVFDFLLWLHLKRFMELEILDFCSFKRMQKP